MKRIVGIIVLVAILAGGSLAARHVWNDHHTAKTNVQQNEHGKYLVIKEWGVRAKNTTDVQLEYVIDTDPKTARFTSKELLASDVTPGCGITGSQNHGGGRISRYLPNETVRVGPQEDVNAAELAQQLVGNGQSAKAGQYLYIYQGEQGECGAHTDLQHKTEDAVKELLKSLETTP